MRELILVRHCQSSGQGSDAPLTETGRSQAARLAQFLSRFELDRLVSSPCLRARQTAQPTAARTGLPIFDDARGLRSAIQAGLR